MSLAIIGSGISGAILSSQIENSKVFERSKHIGGRTTTRTLNTGEIFDIGATYFKNKIPYIEKNEKKIFDFLNFLETIIPDLEICKHKTYPNAYHPKKGMQRISEELLKNKNVYLEHNLETITKSNENNWTLKFSNGHTENFDKVILTAPIPQVISSLKHSGLMMSWDEQIKFRGEYRSTLVLTGIWKNLSPEIISKLLDLEQCSFLFKDEDAEYISIESSKYISDSLVITIQFSSAFSSKNLERWIDEERNPKKYVLNCNQFFFDKVLKLIGVGSLVHIPPDILKVHRWRYSQADFSIFDSENFNLDSEELNSYFKLSKENNLWITGDFLWGPRVIQNALGSYIISKKV